MLLSRSACGVDQV